MGFTPAMRVTAYAVVLLLVAALVWRGVVIYREDQRAGRAAAVAARPGGQATENGTGKERSGGTPGSLPASPPTGAVAPAKKLVQVHVEGAVARPGVYTFEDGARVHEAIAAAGGPLPEAVPGALNLAAPLTDGAKVYVYTRAELQPPSPSAPPPAAQGATYAPVKTTQAAALSQSKGVVSVNLNTATAAELEAVPGIGPTTARAIVEHRTKHGSFKRVEDLTAVSGIGPKTLEKLRPYLKV